MKRPGSEDPSPHTLTIKKPKPDTIPSAAISAVLSDENLLHEILRHADARTLATSACVNKTWRVTARDERLWELICTRHWSTSTGCATRQLRSVVLALGGFRNLHSLYLVPLSRPASATSSSSSATWPCMPPHVVPRAKTRWGKDEVQLSLSLLSIRYFEKMNRGKGV